MGGQRGARPHGIVVGGTGMVVVLVVLRCEAQAVSPRVTLWDLSPRAAGASPHTKMSMGCHEGPARPEAKALSGEKTLKFGLGDEYLLRLWGTLGTSRKGVFGPAQGDAEPFLQEAVASHFCD